MSGRGRASICLSSAGLSWILSADTIWREMFSWMAKTSSRAPVYF